MGYIIPIYPHINHYDERTEGWKVQPIAKIKLLNTGHDHCQVARLARKESFIQSCYHELSVDTQLYFSLTGRGRYVNALI